MVEAVMSVENVDVKWKLVSPSATNDRVLGTKSLYESFTPAFYQVKTVLIGGEIEFVRFI